MNKIVEIASRENWVRVFILAVSLCVTLSPIRAAMISSRKLSFNFLPKGQLIPPPSPNSITSYPFPPTPLRVTQKQMLNFDMLSKSPFLPSSTSRVTHNKMLDFGILPKGQLVPPYGPRSGYPNIPSSFF